MALRIQSHQPARGRASLINLNDIFMTDFAQLGLGSFDANRSTWHKVKAFPRNIELEVAATYAGGQRFCGDDSVIDARGNTVVIHYGLCQLPDDGYQPRLADDRVGHFLSAVKDFSTDSKDTTFVRYVNRWRLERAEPIDPKNPQQAVAAQEEDRLLDREVGARRVPGLRPRGHPRMEQGVREDRLPRRHRGAPAGERGLRSRGHQLQHLPLDHHATTASPWARRGPTR